MPSGALVFETTKERHVLPERLIAPLKPRTWIFIALLVGGLLGMAAVTAGAVVVLQRPDMKPALDRLLSIGEPLRVIDGDTV
jgi:hypothetical protein